MKIGIIGCGAAGRSHIKAYKKIPGVTIAAAADIDEARAWEVGGEFDIPVYTVEKLISEVDVVDISTPTPVHMEIAALAAKKGKDIICETPLARTLHEAENLISICRENGVRLAPVHFSHLTGPLSKVKDMIDSGSIEKIAMCRITRKNKGIPQSAGGWREDFSLSGGVILDTLIQDIVFLIKTIGRVKRVYAYTTQHRESTEGEYALISLGFENGSIAHLDGNWLAAQDGQDELEFAYKGGLITYSDEFFTPLRIALNDRPWGNVLHLSPLEVDAYEAGLSKVCRWLLTGAPLPVTLEECFHGLLVALSALESSRTGQVITLG